MKIPKTISELQQLIADEVEENINLDYKAADALQNTDGKKKEIAKDASAMANSAGGIIIYGIKEFDESKKRHLPESITPVERSKFSKEWLEQVIHSNISPKIDGLLIHPVSLEKEDEVAYVVEIPQSTTAHQNTKDHRYYRRHNFESVPMLDYEIRDIYNRSQHPVIELEFEIEKIKYKRKSDIISQEKIDSSPYGDTTIEFSRDPKVELTLKILTVNKGKIYAKFINYFPYVSKEILNESEVVGKQKTQEGVIKFYGDNTHRDIVDYGKYYSFDDWLPKYGPSRFDPMLPGLHGVSMSLKLIDKPKIDHREITWMVHADNAPPVSGSIALNKIPIDSRIELDE